MVSGEITTITRTPSKLLLENLDNHNPRILEEFYPISVPMVCLRLVQWMMKDHRKMATLTLLKPNQIKVNFNTDLLFRSQAI